MTNEIIRARLDVLVVGYADSPSVAGTVGLAIGTVVRLNNKEVGVVTGINPNSPFCPVVNVMFDFDSKELPQQKLIDLSENKMITIEDCIKT